LHPYLKKHAKNSHIDAALEEACGLARAIDLEIVDAKAVPLSEIRPATMLGKGKVEELAELVEQSAIKLVIVNGELTPIQQRNLEKALQCKVIDRTALILEIFGARARTAEGKLQVELAALNYQKTRLVRSWTHLERQRGGFGFLGGPGESQIEIDRRLIRDRISKIRKELEQVTRTRKLHREARIKVPYPIVALVGYTNAGKSTLFNRITGAKVEARDQLFATLDPTMRALKLPNGGKVILSDTVGFISNLPHELVAAFRATLEEVLEADVLLHVRDISHPDTDLQKQAVETVLAELFGEENTEWNQRLIEVCNKADLVEHRAPDAIHISALTGDGVDALMVQVERCLSEKNTTLTNLKLPVGDGEKLAWLYRHGQVLAKQLEEEVLHVSVRLTPSKLAQFEHLYVVPPTAD
jgi:GTP-binding protein HflX